MFLWNDQRIAVGTDAAGQAQEEYSGSRILPFRNTGVMDELLTIPGESTPFPRFFLSIVVTALSPL